MKESFSVNVQAVGITVMVQVTRQTVTVHGVQGRLCAGVWDRGYVRYVDSQKLRVPPALLDAIDLALRKRMTMPPVETRAEPPRRSAIGY